MRVLIAWELGGNLGHLFPMRAVGDALIELGHEVVYAARDLSRAELALGDAQVRQAPLERPNNDTRPSANMAEILLSKAWTSDDSLRARLRAWMGMMRDARIDLVLCDHAPTAGLAAHLAGLPYRPAGTGFFAPPDSRPMPAIAPEGQSVPSAKLERLEAEATRRMSTASRGLGAPPPDHLGVLFADPLLFTYPELDHYGAREDAYYLGVTPPPRIADAARVPEGTQAFVYLHDLEQAKTTIACLRRAGLRIAACLKNAEPVEQDGVFITRDPLDLDTLPEDCRIAITQGNHATLAQTLVRGIPQICIPAQREQFMLGRRVAENRLGALCLGQQGPESLAQALAGVLSDPGFRERCQRFADDRRMLTPETLRERLAGLL